MPWRRWSDADCELEPQDVIRRYQAGCRGAYREPAQDAALDRRMPRLHFGQYGLGGSGQGQLIRPYLALLKLYPEAGGTPQRRGDCVSWGTAHAVDLTRACEILIKGEPEGWIANAAPEWFYDWRGHSGEGASCARLAKAAGTDGGILLRLDYSDTLGIDLREYNSRTRAWSRNGRPDPAAVREANKHPVRTITRILTLDQARDALANGYGVNVCSGQGFASRRNEDGIAEARGSWAHAMAWVGFDDRPETHRKHGGPLVLILNSWGHSWISGPRTEGQPRGSFWCRHRVAERMLRSRGAFAFSSVDGFPPQKLPDFGATGVI